MKCAVFRGAKQLTIEDRPVPAVGEGQVLIQVKACGVCGTDADVVATAAVEAFRPYANA